MANDFVSGGQFALVARIDAHGKTCQMFWYSPEEVARYEAQSWAEGARMAVNNGAAASLCVEGILPREYTNIH